MTNVGLHLRPSLVLSKDKPKHKREGRKSADKNTTFVGTLRAASESYKNNKGCKSLGLQPLLIITDIYYFFSTV